MVQPFLGGLALLAGMASSWSEGSHEEVVQQVLAKWPHKYVDKFRSECFLTVSFWLSLGQLKSASNRILARAVIFLVELDVETKWDGVSDLGPVGRRSCAGPLALRSKVSVVVRSHEGSVRQVPGKLREQLV